MTTLRSLAKHLGSELPDGPDSTPTGISLCSRRARESSTIRLARRFRWVSNWPREFPQSTPSVSIQERTEERLAPFLPTYTRTIFAKHAATRKPHYAWKSTPGRRKER